MPRESFSSTTEVSAPRVVDVGREALAVIRRLNTEIFDEEHVIETFDRPDLTMLLAYVDGGPVGFKVGYRATRDTFYSAKGGVLSAHRRRGVAHTLLHVLMDRARSKNYCRFVYDTFPNRHPGMTILGLREGFKIIDADYNAEYEDYRLRLEKKL